MTVLSFILAVVLDIIPAGEAFLKPLQQRDSILIADQFRYGFRLDGAQDDIQVGLPDFAEVCNDTLVLVNGWQMDTLATRKQRKEGKFDVEYSVTLAPFEEGIYQLPDLYILRQTSGGIDTLSFTAPEPFEVKTMPVDTATFEIRDIKGQINYPVTVEEVLPYVLVAGAAAWLITAIAVVIAYLARRRRKEESAPKDPPHIVALRELDRYRSDKYWAPERQKTFYSGITGAVKDYIDARFGIDAPEMTTAELFDALKGRTELTPELYARMKELFETADYVKFAKYTAPDEQNSEALPLCVRFVTSTYQAEIEKEAENVL